MFFISENACIARRDGVLKLMFRLVRSIASLHAKLVLYINIEELCLMLPPLAQADVRERQVVNPIVKAFLYTWEERITSEGEYVPVRVQPLELEYIDRIALLPVYAPKHALHEQQVFISMVDTDSLDDTSQDDRASYQ